MANNSTIDDVRKFWNENPLFVGEGKSEVGSREWFLEHEAVVIEDGFLGRDPGRIIAKGVNKDARILDIGCGPGFWVRYFLRHGFENVKACDLTERAVGLTKRSLKLFDLAGNVDVRVGNAENLPYEDGCFDHINCQGVIHHAPDTGKCISEFYRVIKPGGTVCFSVYYKNVLLRNKSLLKAFGFLFAKVLKLKGRGRSKLLMSGDPDETVRMYDGYSNPVGKSYTLWQLKSFLDGMFEILEYRYFYFPVRVLPVRMPRALHALLDRCFGLMIVIRCRKKEQSAT